MDKYTLTHLGIALVWYRQKTSVCASLKDCMRRDQLEHLMSEVLRETQVDIPDWLKTEFAKISEAAAE